MTEHAVAVDNPRVIDLFILYKLILPTTAPLAVLKLNGHGLVGDQTHLSPSLKRLVTQHIFLHHSKAWYFLTPLEFRVIWRHTLLLLSFEPPPVVGQLHKEAAPENVC